MKKKQGILFFVAILAIATIAIYFWATNLLKGVEEDDRKSATIAPAIRNIFSQSHHIDDYPYQPAAPEWEGNYLILENTYSDSMSVRYSAKWNELLGSDKNFPGKEAKGVVIIETKVDIEASFEGTLGIPTDTKAMRRSYIISYFDIARKAILARDTLVGEDPPKTIRRGQSGAGAAPADDLVLRKIKQRIRH